MNNLFRINKENLENFLNVYESNKNNKKHIKKLNTEKSKKITESKINTLNTNTNTNKILTNPNQTNKTSKKKFDKIKKSQKEIQKKISKEMANKSKLSESNKIIWKFGKTTIKLEKIKKNLKNNILIFKKINKLFVEFIKSNPNIDIESILLADEQNKQIFSNSFGTIKSNPNYIDILIDSEDITGNYHLVDFGMSKISDIKLNNGILNKNKIPNFDSILNFPNNIKHIFKTLKLFSTNTFKIKTQSLFDKLELDKILFDNFYDTIKQLILNDSIFKSDEKYMLYVELFDLTSNAFFIDKTNKLMYWITSIEKHSSSNPSIIILYYVLKLNSQYKIKNYSNKIMQEDSQNIETILKSKKNLKIISESELEINPNTQNNLKKNYNSELNDINLSNNNNNLVIYPATTNLANDNNIQESDSNSKPNSNSESDYDSKSSEEIIKNTNNITNIKNPNIIEFEDSSSSDYEYFKSKFNIDIPKSNIVFKSEDKLF